MPKRVFQWVAALALSVSSLLAQSDIGPPGNSPRWRPMGGFPGTSGPVHCSAVDAQGNLFIGGSFFIAGDVRSHSIAKWDGTKWISMSPPLTHGGAVEALAFDAQGNLYAGGAFRDIGGIPALRIAKWDGTRWHAMGTGLGFNGTYASQSVKAIAIGPDGQVYAGGFFAEAGTVTVNHIARWDGSQWQPLGSGLIDSSPSVNALAFDAQGNLYATGRFSWRGDNTAISPGIAKWNGSTWSGIGTGLGGFPYPYAIGRALIFDNTGDLVVAGQFTSAGGLQTKNIARWNGVSWSTFGTAGPAAGIEAASNGIHALGLNPAGEIVAASGVAIINDSVRFEVLRWNGSAWVNAIPHPAVGGVIRTFLIMPDGDYVLGGDFKVLGTGNSAFHASHLVRWDGTNFHRFGNGPDGMVRVLKFAANRDLIAGGSFKTIGGIEASGVARFDGENWWPYGSGVDGDVQALALGTNGELFVGGKFNNAGGVASKSVARWDGSQWVSLDGGLTQTSTVPTVQALALAPNGALYVGGLFSQSVSGTPLSGIARWQNGAWNNLNGGCLTSDSVPVPRNGNVKGLLINAQGHLIACGNFDRMGSGSGLTRHIARWDGTQWHPVGPTANQTRPFDPYFGIDCMAMSPDGVLHIGHDVYYSISRLVSNTWQALGNGFSGKPHAIAFADAGGVYAGGIVTLTGPSPRHVLRGITYWNGARWSSLGNEGLGMDDAAPDVMALATDDRGNLILGGDFFGSSDGVVSPFLIRTRTDDFGVWPILGSLPTDRLGPLDRNGPLGLQNLAAYAMALNPLLARMADLPRLSVPAVQVPAGDEVIAADEVEPVMKFSYRRNRLASGIVTQVMASPDLVDWNPAVILSAEVLEQTTEWEWIEVTVARNAAAKFLRLAIDFDDGF